jgi:hypothetical protein
VTNRHGLNFLKLMSPRQIEKQKDEWLRCLDGNPFVRHVQKIGDRQRTKVEKWFYAHSPKCFAIKEVKPLRLDFLNCKTEILQLVTLFLIPPLKFIFAKCRII